MTEKKMVEDLRSLAVSLAESLNGIDSESFGALSDAYEKIADFNKSVQGIKGMACYFNSKKPVDTEI